MKKIQNQVRQGDVLLQPVAELPPDVETVPGKGRIILAYGEATGHHHSFGRKGIKEFRHTDGRRFVQLSKPSTLEHQEHAPIVLQPGVYEVRQQVEYWLDEVRQVVD